MFYFSYNVSTVACNAAPTLLWQSTFTFHTRNVILGHLWENHKHSFQTKFDVNKFQILDQLVMLVPFRPWFCHCWPVDQLTGRWPLKLALVNRIKMGFNFFEWLTKTRPTCIQEMLQIVNLPKFSLAQRMIKAITHLFSSTCLWLLRTLQCLRKVLWKYKMRVLTGKRLLWSKVYFPTGNLQLG